jgi:hypothetical protein
MAGKSRVTADEDGRGPLKSVSAFARPRRGGSSARFVIDAVWLDEPAHCGGLRRARGHGSALAELVRQGRCRGTKGDDSAGPGPGEDRCSAAGRDTFTGSAGCQPAQLDDRAPHGRDRGARGHQDRPVATVQGAAKKTSAGGGPGTR